MSKDTFANRTPLKGSLEPFAALTDAEVVRRILEGETPLFELLMRRYNRRLYRIAWSVLKDAALAQDAVQEGYLQAFTHLEQFRGPLGLGAWLSKIVVRQALNQRRSRSRVELVAPQDTAAQGTEPELLASTSEAAQLAESAIQDLPAPYRMVFILREVEELSIEETADSLDLSTGTVKSRLHRAKAALRASLRNPSNDGIELLPFAGARCDAIVAGVFYTLGTRNKRI